MARIGNIDIAMRASTADLESDLVKASAAVQRFAAQGGKLTGALKSAGAAASGVGAALAGVAGGVGLLAVLGWAKSMGEELDRVGKKAASLGMELNKLRELEFVGDLSGVDPESLEKAIKKQVKMVSEAAKGGDKSALNELGLDAAKLNAMKPDEALLKIAAALDKVKNTNDKVRLSMEVWGKEGDALLNLGNADEIKQGMEDARRAIGYISEESLAATERMNDSISALWLGLKGFVQQGYGEASKAVFGVVDGIKSLVPANEEATKAAEEYEKTVKKIADEEERAVKAAAKRDEYNKKVADKSKAGDDLMKKLEEERYSAWGGSTPLGRELDQWMSDAQSKGLDTAEIYKKRAEMTAIYEQIQQIKKDTPAKEFVDELAQEASTFDMSARAAKIYKMQQDGVRQSIIDQAREMDKKLSILEEEKKAQEEAIEAENKAREAAKRMVEESKTPIQKFKEELAQAKEYLAKGLITDDEYQSIVDKMRRDIDSKMPGEEPQQDTKFSFAGLARRGSTEEYQQMIKWMLPDQDKGIGKLNKTNEDQLVELRQMKAILSNQSQPDTYDLN